MDRHGNSIAAPGLNLNFQSDILIHTCLMFMFLKICHSYRKFYFVKVSFLLNKIVCLLKSRKEFTEATR